MIAWGADINAQDDFGITPLHIAVQNAEEIKTGRIVRLLLIKGAERYIKDKYNRFPIDIAKNITL